MAGCSSLFFLTNTLDNGFRMTPMRHKHDAGISRKWPCVREDNFWTGGTVGIILRDERYIGTVLYGKRERKQIGHWSNQAVDRSDWIICEDQHEAIISKEDFDTVQSLLAQRPSKPYAPQTDRPLKRKVFCGVCGHTMQRDTKPYVQYRCRTHSYTDEYACTGHGIDEADILGVVEDAIRVYARLAVRLDQMNAVRQERSRREKKESGKKLFALQNEKLRLDSRLQELYESFFNGEISREKYLAQKSSITEREQEIAAGIHCLEQSMAEASAGQSEAIAKYIGYAELNGLTADMLDELVKRVTVYPGDVLEVQLNFTDEQEMLSDDLQAG